ncbi:MAG: histidine phosphatase family protein [Aureliella sp.]
MSQCQLLLIRHGQSSNNALPEEERVCDPGLTELGKRQADLVATGLADASITHLYCSPFRRALETVRPLARAKSMSVSVNPHIFERGGCYSGYDRIGKRGEPGMGHAELVSEYPGWEISDEISDDGWWGRDFETDQQCHLRAERVARWMTRELAPVGGCHAMVIHADFKMILGPKLLAEGRASSEELSESSKEFLRAPNNTGITAFRWSGNGWQLKKYNCTVHLTAAELSV